MGVMPCHRGNCTNILCDRYSSKFGYICNECFEELVASKTLDVAAFMKTDPDTELPSFHRDWYEDIFPEGA
jgi:hypothetical protein